MNSEDERDIAKGKNEDAATVPKAPRWCPGRPRGASEASQRWRGGFPGGRNDGIAFKNEFWEVSGPAIWRSFTASGEVLEKSKGIGRRY